MCTLCTSISCTFDVRKRRMVDDDDDDDSMAVFIFLFPFFTVFSFNLCKCVEMLENYVRCLHQIECNTFTTTAAISYAKHTVCIGFVFRINVNRTNLISVCVCICMRYENGRQSSGITIHTNKSSKYVRQLYTFVENS